MGETQKRSFPLSFKSSLRVGARATSDGGLILVSKLDVRSAEGWGELLLPEI